MSPSGDWFYREDMTLDDRYGPPEPLPGEDQDTDHDQYIDAVLLAAELGVYDEGEEDGG